MTANARRYLSLAVWVALLAVFVASALRPACASPYPVAACVVVAVVSLVGIFCALSEFFGAPFDDARFERRINRELARNAEGETR